MNSRILVGILVLPLVLFIEYLVFILLGCTAELCGATDHFYCTVYCKIAIGVLILTGAILLYRFIFSFRRNH
jgi:hypothetical protein